MLGRGGHLFRFSILIHIYSPIGDLRLLLCGNATDCPYLQASEWTLTSFLQNYFKTPENLIHGFDQFSVRDETRTLEEVVMERESNPPSQFDGHATMEDYLWRVNPWVVCLKNGTCEGSIPKEDWLANRGLTCKTEVVNFLKRHPGALAIEMDLCNLNYQMNGLCKDILDYMLKVSAANCLAIGDDTCMEKSFFYSPSTFSSSNQEVTFTHLNRFPKCTLILRNLFMASFQSLGWVT